MACAVTSSSRRRPRTPSAFSSSSMPTTPTTRGLVATALLALQLVSGSGVVQQKLYGLPTGLAYYVDVNVGQARTSSRGSSGSNSFSLLIDTGSSNTAVVTADCCSSTSTSLFSCSASSTCVAQSQEISVSYITGSWSGQLVEDTFSSSEIGTVTGMPFVEIEEESNFIQSGYDGIIGLAYASIASPTGDAPTPYFDVLRNTKSLTNVFSMLMCGSLQAMLVKDVSYTDELYSGELLLGGTTGTSGQKYYQDDLVYTPLVQERWYNVLTTGIKVGSDQIDVSCKEINTPRTIIDSGTSNIAFPSAVYTAIVDDLRTKVQKVLPGVGDSFFSDSVPCCSSYCDPTDKNSSIFELPSLTISLALDGDGKSDEQISVTIPPEYIWRPLMLATTFGVQKCRVFGISEGDLTLLGDVFMDGLFTVHDRESQRMGLGVAKSCPNGVTSTKTITVEKLSSSQSSYCDCVSNSDKKKSLLSSYLPFSSKPCFFWIWWMYVVLAAAVLILVSICVVIYVCFQRRRLRRQTRQLRLRRQQSNALDRNLLTPQCDAGTPPAAVRPSGRNPTQHVPFPSGPRPSNLTSSTNSSARQSDVHVDMRQPHNVV